MTVATPASHSAGALRSASAKLEGVPPRIGVRSSERVREPRRSGFTLIELLIVIAVVGILAAVALPRLAQVPLRAKEAVLRTDLHTMRDVINQHYADKGSYPPSLEALVDGGYLRTVPVDPMTDSGESWVVVFEQPDEDLDYDFSSFDEEAEPGIIDVYSGAEGTALDGSAYADW